MSVAEDESGIINSAAFLVRFVSCVCAEYH